MVKEDFQRVIAYRQALDLLQKPSEKAPIEAAIGNTIFEFSQLSTSDERTRSLIDLFSGLILEGKRPEFAEQLCQDTLCFSPQELQVAYQAIGREEDASQFAKYADYQSVPSGQLATRLGNLHLADR